MAQYATRISSYSSTTCLATTTLLQSMQMRTFSQSWLGCHPASMLFVSLSKTATANLTSVGSCSMQVRRFVVWLHSFVMHIQFVDETSDWSKTPTEMRMNSPGWSFVSWFLLEHFYHNVDGSNTDRSQKGVFSQITGARAEFTFFGTWYGPEPAYRDSVNLIALCPATTHHCRQPRKCNISHW